MNTSIRDKYTHTDMEIQHDNEKQIILALVGESDFNIKQQIIEHSCPQMFTNSIYRKVYNIVIDIYKNNIEIYDQNIIARLDKEEQKRFLIELMNEYITARTYKFHLEKLINAYIQRLLNECDTIEGYEEIKKLKEKYSLKAQTRPIWEDTDNLICDYCDRWENPIQTYYKSIDNIIGSLQGGDILILAGATGMGKSCMMLNLLVKMAKHGKKILLFSLEMSAEQLQNRIISAETGIHASKYRNYEMTDDEFKQYCDFAQSDKFKLLSIDVCTEYHITIDRLTAIVNESDADIVFIDYLGLISSNKGANTYERVSEISRELKLLAMSSKKPFVVLHQLNRTMTDRADKRPQLSDLRDSGKIEQDADFICFVYRPAYYDKSMDKNALEFIVKKNRHGEANLTARLIFDGATQRITDVQGETPQAVRQCGIGY